MQHRELRAENSVRLQQATPKASPRLQYKELRADDSLCLQQATLEASPCLQYRVLQADNAVCLPQLTLTASPRMQHRELRADSSAGNSVCKGSAEVPGSVCAACPLQPFPSSPQPRPRQEPSTYSFMDRLDLKAGDILFIQGLGGLTEIGTTGGYFGHFLVIVSAPEFLSANEAKELRDCDAGLLASRSCKVETVESTRNHCGLHRSHHVIYADPDTGCLSIAAELLRDRDGMEFVPVLREPLQIWRSPSEIRAKVSSMSVCQVLTDMQACEQNWSLTTAAKAALMSASVLGRKRDDSLLEELSACWQQAPICTSIVVIFWQRLLGRIAIQFHDDHLDLILKWLPLKADRGLPGEVLAALDHCGWDLKQRL